METVIDSVNHQKVELSGYSMDLDALNASTTCKILHRHGDEVKLQAAARAVAFYRCSCSWILALVYFLPFHTFTLKASVLKRCTIVLVITLQVIPENAHVVSVLWALVPAAPNTGGHCPL
eukprot:1161818-Pelagomonas_calceolata.AAC.2